MPSTVIVNFLTTQHKLSSGVTSAFPDVCKTPAPPAPSPIPIPYPNIGNSISASSKVTKKVKNDGQKVMVKGSNYTITNGDQAGVALGIISNKIMGKSGPLNQAFSVKYENKGVARLTDPHGNNSGSKFNSPNPAQVQPVNVLISKPNYVVYMKGDQKRIRFKADESITAGEATEERNYTTWSEACVTNDDLVYVVEGRHRAIGVSHGDVIGPDLGGVPGQPGWLDYKYYTGTDGPSSTGPKCRDLSIDYDTPDVSKAEAHVRYEDKFGIPHGDD